jgi:hypothetical protein
MNSPPSSLIVLLRLLWRESRQRKRTCPFSRLMSLPLEIRLDGCSGPDTSERAPGRRKEAWSRPPTLFVAGFQAGSRKRVV